MSFNCHDSGGFDDILHTVDWNRLIEEERRKSDLLLLNILPEEIAHDLKTSGKATPRHYDLATVVFTDFINFTKLSSKFDFWVLCKDWQYSEYDQYI